MAPCETIRSRVLGHSGNSSCCGITCPSGRLSRKLKDYTSVAHIPTWHTGCFFHFFCSSFNFQSIVTWSDTTSWPTPWTDLFLCTLFILSASTRRNRSIGLIYFEFNFKISPWSQHTSRKCSCCVENIWKNISLPNEDIVSVASRISI